MKNKAKRISQITLWVILSITIFIAVLFYFGGEVTEAQRIVYDLPQPAFTDLVIGWVFILLILTLLTIFSFGIFNYFKNYEDSPIQRTIQLYSAGGLILLLVLTWFIGDGSALKIAGYAGHDNTAFWLKTADMWFYSICILILTAVGLIVSFGIRNFLNHRKEH